MSTQFGQQIQAYVRCRPLRMNERPVVDIERNEVHLDVKKFYFDDVFDQESSQDEVYKTVVRPLVDQVLDGYNCTVFAYGQTGTGKTYTMEGIIPQAIDHIFKILARYNKDYAIRVSFLELYNEEAYDLLTEDFTKLKVFDDNLRKGLVHGQKEIHMNSKDDIKEVLRQGTAKRKTNATLINACSSRSHTIFNINLQVKEGDIIKMGKLRLVDLAGSESIARSGATKEVAREAGSINQSLLTLGRVIKAITENSPHVPYRESKLTRILQDSLGGKTRTSMIATISPADVDSATTLSTLEYASRARSVVNQPEVNQQSLQKTKGISSTESVDGMLLEMAIRNEVAVEFKIEIDKMKLSFDTKSLEMKNEYDKANQDTRIELEQTKKDLEDMREELEETKKNLEETRKELEGAKRAIESYISAIESANDIHEETNAKLDLKVKELASKKEELALKDKVLVSTIEQHDVAYREMKAQIDDLEKELESDVRRRGDTNQETEAKLKETEKELELAVKRHDNAYQEVKARLDAKEKELKVTKQLADYRNTLNLEIEEKLKGKELEIKSLRDEIESLRENRSSESPEQKKAARIRTKALVTEECGGDYANMTFEGGDEIALVNASVKKSRKKVGAGTKRRVINPTNPAIMLSGKKRKLKNNESDTELSPVPLTRVTRSRATKRKLDFNI